MTTDKHSPELENSDRDPVEDKVFNKSKRRVLQIGLPVAAAALTGGIFAGINLSHKTEQRTNPKPQSTDQPTSQTGAATPSGTESASTPAATNSEQNFNFAADLCANTDLSTSIEKATAASSASCNQTNTKYSKNIDILDFNFTVTQETANLAIIELVHTTDNSAIPTNFDGPEITIQGDVCRETSQGLLVCFLGKTGLASLLLNSNDMAANQAVMTNILKAASQ